MGIALFLPIAWVVLISRLVHDEELVGDRQFWITRPYTWYSLLGSKLLALIVLIGLPLVIMQIWLVHHAGMYPTKCSGDTQKPRSLSASLSFCL